MQATVLISVAVPAGDIGFDMMLVKLHLAVLQVCGLKLVESQLLASLAAANARSDAACLRAQRLAAALEAASAKLAAVPLQQQGPADAVAAGEGTSGASAADLALQVVQLTAQAGSRSQEVYRLQDQLLQAKQVSSGRSK